jgi:hypothetical protein
MDWIDEKLSAFTLRILERKDPEKVKALRERNIAMKATSMQKQFRAQGEDQDNSRLEVLLGNLY